MGSRRIAPSDLLVMFIKKIIKVVNRGRWFALAVCDGMRRQDRVLINFSSGADGRQKSRINHRWQLQSASLLVCARSPCDKLTSSAQSYNKAKETIGPQRPLLLFALTLTCREALNTALWHPCQNCHTQKNVRILTLTYNLHKWNGCNPAIAVTVFFPFQVHLILTFEKQHEIL